MDLLVLKNKTKTILIVDNLDRCTTAEMLNIIESINLLINDRELRNILQTVILIDDQKLRFAIAEKYSYLIGIEYENKNESYSETQKNTLPKNTPFLNLHHKIIIKQHNLVEEQIDKLFVSHLKLIKLTVKDIVELNRKYFDGFSKINNNISEINRLIEIINTPELFELYFENKIDNVTSYLSKIDNAISYKMGSISNDKIENSFVDILNKLKIKVDKLEHASSEISNINPSIPKQSIPKQSNIKQSNPEPETQIQKQNISTDTGLHFTIQEEIFIIKSLNDSHGKIEINPRFIRAFIFKYILARSIIKDILNTDLPKNLSELIIKKIYNYNSENSEIVSEIDNVVKQVI